MKFANLEWVRSFYPLSICTWFFKISISQNWFLNLIFELIFWLFRTWFLQATQAVKIKLKNQVLCFCLPGTSSALMAQLVLWHQTLLLFYFMVFFARNTDQVITKLCPIHVVGFMLMSNFRFDNRFDIKLWNSFHVIKTKNVVTKIKIVMV